MVLLMFISESILDHSCQEELAFSLLDILVSDEFDWLSNDWKFNVKGIRVIAR